MAAMLESWRRACRLVPLAEAIEKLVSDPGSNVTVHGQDVTVQAQWTGWQAIEFRGDSLANNLREAAARRDFYRRAHPND